MMPSDRTYMRHKSYAHVLLVCVGSEEIEVYTETIILNNPGTEKPFLNHLLLITTVR